MSADPFAHRPRRAWRRLSVEAPAELADAVAGLLAEVTGAGVECAAADAGRERIVGYLLEGADAAAMEAGLRAGLAALAARVPEAGPIAVRADPVLEEDWGGSWKVHFRPFAASPGLVVKPSWEAYEPTPGVAVIEMDPGMAFGTGLHASTRLALRLVEERLAGGAPVRVLDLGTGTGILAMACALRGAEVVAADNDPDAVAAARANVERNRLGDRVRVTGEDLEALGGPFELVVANITADVLEALASPLAARVAPGGALVLSGILAGAQAAEVRAAYERLGLRCTAAREEGEWAALAFGKGAAEEIFELVDEEGRVVGRAPRSACHGNPALLHRAAHVVVLDGRGRLYLQRRALTKDIQPGKWDTSVGGHVDVGEDHEAAAHREMREELGLAGGLRLLYRYLWRTERESELVATYVHVAGAEPRPDPGEVDEGRWFTRPEADALVASGAATPNLAEELRRLAAAGEF
jgi:ribosomal protein L11 methyltransferase